MYELLPVFICANNTEILINSLFGINIINPEPSFASSASPSSSGMGCVSSNSLVSNNSSFLSPYPDDP